MSEKTGIKRNVRNNLTEIERRIIIKISRLSESSRATVSIHYTDTVLCIVYTDTVLCIVYRDTVLSIVYRDTVLCIVYRDTEYSTQGSLECSVKNNIIASCIVSFQTPLMILKQVSAELPHSL